MPEQNPQPVWERTPTMQKPEYKIDERPQTWWECLLYGWQHTLVDISPFVLPLAVAAALGMDDAAGARLINFCLFAMGVATLIQTTIGNRLPIVQGPSATLIGTLAPLAASLGAAAMWLGVMIGGIVEMAIGASKILKYLRRLFPIVVSGVVIISIGVSLGTKAIGWVVAAGSKGSTHYLLAIAVVLSIAAFRFGCRNFARGVLARGSIFFSIWIVGLLIGGALGKVNWGIVAEKQWFSLPQLFPYGEPWNWEIATGTLLVATLTVMVGYLGSMVESLGDYAATCAVAGETYTVEHMNKGIFAEGLGAVVASLFGGLPCTSYTQNIGIIAATKVASRFVVQIAACILLIYGLCPKFGALLIAIPRSVLSAVFVVVCGMIVVSGAQLLRAAEKTPANYFVVVATLAVAIGLPHWAQRQQWLEEAHAFVQLLLTNTVVLAVIVGILLNLSTRVSTR